MRGLTVLELMLATMIVGILGVIATTVYQGYRERMQIAQAVTDIGVIESAVVHYGLDNGGLPQTLDEIGRGGMRDPWGNAYQYLNHATADGKAGFRKDKNIVPINSDFDLYSMGKDGASVAPLTAKPSRDDIVRANNGRFIGLASDYDP